MPEPKKVLIRLTRSISLFGELIRGIRAYRPRNAVWHYIVEPFSVDRSGRTEGVAGVIGAFTEAEFPSLQALGVPVVNVSGRLSTNPFPTATCDNQAIGRMAAEYFLNRGFSSYAFARTDDSRFAHQRQLGFCTALADRGYEVEVLAVSPENAVDALRRLARPVGLLAATDDAAARLVERATEAGIEVPGDLAVLGVDNDEDLAEAAPVQLSSIDVNGERIGQVAAEMLERLMCGDPPPSRPVLVPPRRIVERASTARTSSSDPLVQQALQYICDHACTPMQIAEMMEQFHVSRRTLEKRFRKSLGCTPLQAIQRFRMEHAQQLLRSTELRVSDIAGRCGFEHLGNFTDQFRRATGHTPSAFRQASRETKRGHH